MEDIYKEVKYDEYCETCEHGKLSENEDPCEECLDTPLNLYSNKPVRWTEKK